MGRRGPVPTPTSTLKQRGTYRKDRRPKKEPAPDSGKPRMPADMTPEAKKIWPRLVKEIETAGTLFVSDASTIAVTCEAKAEYDQARELVRSKGIYLETEDKKYPVANPAVAMCNQTWTRYMQGLDRFGLSPSARTRVELASKETEKTNSEVSRMFV